MTERERIAHAEQVAPLRLTPEERSRTILEAFSIASEAIDDYIASPEKRHSLKTRLRVIASAASRAAMSEGLPKRRVRASSSVGAGGVDARGDMERVEGPDEGAQGEH